MFGYVRICKPELKVRAYEEYRAVYCSLCKTIGKEYGVAARALLNYDVTFYILLRDCAESGVVPVPEYKKGRCPFNPAKRCNYQTNCGESYQAAAALTVILSYHKVRDNIEDGRGFKKIAASLVYPAIWANYKKAKKRYPRFAEIAETAMRAQSKLEQAGCASTDEAAHPSAQALAALFTEHMEDGAQKRVVARIAYCLGRWVYLMDAYDDMRGDFQTGAYNPFLLKYTVAEASALSADPLQEEVLRSLHMTANEAAISFSLLDGVVHREVLENILQDGLETATQTVQRKYKEVKQDV